MDVGAPARDRPSPGGQPGVRRRGQPLRDVQRIARPTAAGRRSSRSSADGARVPFVSDLSNADVAGLRPRRAVCTSPAGSTGACTRWTRRGRRRSSRRDLGVACGIAFGPDGDLFVGDRSGSILRVARRRTEVVASLPPSVAAFHLAFGPDELPVCVGADDLVCAIGSIESRRRARRAVRRRVSAGRRGIAFDADGRLYVVDALAGAQRSVSTPT